MENHELIKLVSSLPPDAKRQVEDLAESLASQFEENKHDRGYGSLKGFITYMADDFDAPLKEFHEYMYNIGIEFIEKIEKLPVEDQKEIEAIVDQKLAGIEATKI